MKKRKLYEEIPWEEDDNEAIDKAMIAYRRAEKLKEIYENKPRLVERFEILVKTIIQIQPLYNNCKNESQLAFIETMIGAGLWYLGKGVWTGKISKNVLKLFLSDSGIEDPKFTEDHEYPRKVSARELLMINWMKYKNPTKEMVSQFIQKYGRVNYVTKNENSRLTKFQKADVFTTPETAYQKAKVELIQISKEQLDKIKKRNDSEIMNILNQNN